MSGLFGFDNYAFAEVQSLEVSALCEKFRKNQTLVFSKLKWKLNDEIRENLTKNVCVCVVLAAHYRYFLLDACIRVNFLVLYDFGVQLCQINFGHIDYRLINARLLDSMKKGGNTLVKIHGKRKSLEAMSTEYDSDPSQHLLVSLTAILYASENQLAGAMRTFHHFLTATYVKDAKLLSLLLTFSSLELSKLRHIFGSYDGNNFMVKKGSGCSNLAFEKEENNLYLKSYDLICKAHDCLKHFQSHRECKEKELAAFKMLVNVHFKAKNYYGCLTFLVDNERLSDSMIGEMSTEQKDEIYRLCVTISTNILELTKKETFANNANHEFSNSIANQVDRSVKLCHLGAKINPNSEEIIKVLCNILRSSGSLDNAIIIAENLLERNPDSVDILLIHLLCLIDLKHPVEVIQYIESSVEYLDTRVDYFKAVLLILSSKVIPGLSIVKSTLEAEYENICRFLDICKSLSITTNSKVCEYLCNVVKSSIRSSNIEEYDELLRLACEILVTLHPGNEEYAILQSELLLNIEKFDEAQKILLDFVERFNQSTTSILYLAKARLKQGAYVAATDDFRLLLRRQGSFKLASDLLQFSEDDRREIARVTRLHAFQFISKEHSYIDATECLSVAICAIGTSAIGLVLARAFCYMHTNSYSDASKDWNRVLAKYPLTPSALCGRAVLNAITTHVEEAIQDFENAYRLDRRACFDCLKRLPLDSASSFVQLISRFVEQNLDDMTGEKDEIYRSYIYFLCQLFPTRGEFLCLNISYYFRKHEFSAALHEANLAILHLPNDAALKIWYSVLLIHKKRTNEAAIKLSEVSKEKSLIKSIFYKNTSRNQRSELFESSLTIAKKKQTEVNYKDAIKMYNICVLIDSCNIEVIRGRMECLEKVGEIKKSQRDLDTIIRLEPNVQDFCMRAKRNYYNDNLREACTDYVAAIELDEVEAVTSAINELGVEAIIKMFVSCAEISYLSKNIKDMTKICDSGLKIDRYNKEMRRLQRKGNSQCSIQ